MYSRAWTRDAARRLLALRARADRITDGRKRTRYDKVVDTIGQGVDLERRTV